MGFQNRVSRELSGPLITSLPAAAKHRSKHACCIHPGWRKSLNRQTHPPSPHPFLPCCCNAFSKPRVLPLHCIVPTHWGMGRSDRFKQRASEKDNRQLCIWRVKYAREAKVGEGKGEHHCVTLFPTPRHKHTHTCTHTLPSSNRWEDVSECEQWAPPSLFYHPHCWGQLGGRHSFFSAFRGKQKSVWNPSHTHVHVFRHTHTTHPQKNCQCNCWLLIFQQPGLASQQRYECWAWDICWRWKSQR